MEIVKKAYDIILADRQTKVREVAKVVGVSYRTAIDNILDKLGMGSVLRLLTVDNKQIWLSTSLAVFGPL